MWRVVIEMWKLIHFYDLILNRIREKCFNHYYRGKSTFSLVCLLKSITVSVLLQSFSLAVSAELLQSVVNMPVSVCEGERATNPSAGLKLPVIGRFLPKTGFGLRKWATFDSLPSLSVHFNASAVGHLKRPRMKLNVWFIGGEIVTRENAFGPSLISHLDRDVMSVFFCSRSLV